MALAGECYRASVKAYEEDPHFMPDGYLGVVRQFETDVIYWQNNSDDDFGDIGERDAIVIASLARPWGPQLLAYERGRDVSEFGVSVTYDDAVTDLFGAEADALCGERHLELDAATRLRLLGEIAKAYRLLDRKLLRNADGDYSPDANASRFPPFVPPVAKPATAPSRPPRRPSLGMQGLFERWREVHGPSVAASTVRRYGPSIASLEAFTKGKDARLLTDDDV